MSNWTENPESYRRYLPHLAPAGVTLFVTFRLKDSLPKEAIDKLRTQREMIAALERLGKTEKGEISNLRKKLFAHFDALLDHAPGSHFLRDPHIAQVVADTILGIEREGHIRVSCFTVMSNHVHLLFSLTENGKSLREAMQLIKGRSAYLCNKVLGQKGTFWQHESYDHVVREGEFERIVRYILMNPVKAGIVEEWEDYSFTYLAPNLRGMDLQQVAN